MSSIVTGEAVALDIRPASLAARAVSCFIDAVAYAIVYIALVVCAAWLIGRFEEINLLLTNTLIIILMVCGLLLIPCAVELLTRGKSLGRLICGLRIVRDDGGAISFRHAFIRTLLWQFEVLSTGGGVAAFVGLLSSRSKRLGDYLAGTIAVNERAGLPRSAQVTVPAHLVPWITHADIAPVPSGLHYRMVQFLTTADQRTPESRLERAIELATELNPHIAPAPPQGTHPEDFITAVVGHLRWETGRRLAAAEQTTQTFRERVGTLPHGLRL